MTKPVLFYFVHAHGAGHRATFHMLYPAFSKYFTVIAITTNSEITDYLCSHYDVTVIELPPKYPPNYVVPEHTFSKAFEVTPYVAEPAKRAAALAGAIEQYCPAAFYCDGVPEIAIMVRGMGVPVILVRLPGNVMVDPTQVFAYELADHVVAHFPEALEQPDYKYTNKTVYSGYLSKYARFSKDNLKVNDTVSVILGYDTYPDRVLETMTDNDFKFVILGNTHTYKLGSNCRQVGRVDNIAESILGSVVISAAGQNTIAELLSLRKQLILLPEPRPYDEQSVHASMLKRQGIAFKADDSFNADEWRDMIEHAIKSPLSYDNKTLIGQDAPERLADKLKEWYA